MTKPVTRKMAVDSILYWLTIAALEQREDQCFHNVAHSIFIRCNICKRPLFAGDDIQFDHIHADVFDGPHEYQNLRPVHYECHKKKTARDIKDNAKIKRLRGELKPKPKRNWGSRPLEGRGFEKELKRKMSGEVARR